MKYLLLCLTSLLTGFASAQAPTYDSTLAHQWKADPYGMRMYILVFLRTGDYQPKDKHTQDSLQRGHLDNIKRLAAEGKLVVAGPLGDNDKKYEGIFVFATSSLAEAKSWVGTDPAVQAHELEPEYMGWYCTAALMGIPDAHARVAQKTF